MYILDKVFAADVLGDGFARSALKLFFVLEDVRMLHLGGFRLKTNIESLILQTTLSIYMRTIVDRYYNGKDMSVGKADGFVPKKLITQLCSYRGEINGKV